MEAEHQGKNWPEIKSLSKNRIRWQTFIKALCLCEGWKDILLLLCVQTSSDAHPASYLMGTRSPLPGVERSWGVTLTTHPHLVPRSIMRRSYITSPSWQLHGGNRTAL
jgi:hypothetical protein